MYCWILSNILHIPFIRLKGAKEKLKLDEHSFTVTLTDVLRRYVYFIEEKDIEYDIQRPENLNQFYLINNYSAEVPEVLKEVSTKEDL